MRILLGVTGSVAAVLTPKMIRALTDAGHEVRVIATEHSMHFWDPLAATVLVYRDADERREGFKLGDEVLHIELRRWAEAIVIAPLTAQTLAKLATGQADNLLTCVMRAWDFSRPVIVAPAMNTHMWQHPITHVHLAQLSCWYETFLVAQPVSKVLACGDTGIGAMAPIVEIVALLGSVNPERLAQ